MELLNVATAMELRWLGNWSLPSLQGETRMMKPPLSAWLTASIIPSDLLEQLRSPEASARKASQAELAARVRTLALLYTVLMLVGVYALGASIGDPMLGVIAAAICASTLLIDRYARWCTYDVPFALMITWANVCLAQWALRSKRWLGAIGAGLCMGVAVLIKGPVAILQTALPVAIFALLCLGSLSRSAAGRMMRRNVAPVLVGGLLLLSVAIPWFIYVAARIPDALTIWLHEVLRINVSARPSMPYAYLLLLLRLSLPWTPALVVGLAVGIAALLRRDEREPTVLPTLLIIVPVVIMSLASDRKGHYLLPLAGPLAILSGQVIREHLRRFPRWTKGEVVLAIVHWQTVAAVTLTILLGSAWIGREEGSVPSEQSFWPVAAAGLSVLIIGLGIRWHRQRFGLVAAPLLGMLLIHGVEDWKNSALRAPPRPLATVAEEIWREHPDAPVYVHHPSGNRADALEAGAELEILLGRIVRWTPAPATESASAVVVLGQNRIELRKPEKL